MQFEKGMQLERGLLLSFAVLLSHTQAHTHAEIFGVSGTGHCAQRVEGKTPLPSSARQTGGRVAQLKIHCKVPTFTTAPVAAPKFSGLCLFCWTVGSGLRWGGEVLPASCEQMPVLYSVGLTIALCPPLACSFTLLFPSPSYLMQFADNLSNSLSNMV